MGPISSPVEGTLADGQLIAPVTERSLVGSKSGDFIVYTAAVNTRHAVSATTALCSACSSDAAGVEVPVGTQEMEHLVNRSELVNAVAEKTDIPRMQVEAVLAATLDQIMAATPTEKVILAGFGTFEARDRAAREGRNPGTGETLQIAASRGVGFKAATAFKQHIAAAG